MMVLTSVQPDLFEGPNAAAASHSLVCVAPEGTYVDLKVLAPPRQALIMGMFIEPSVLAAILPLDDLFEDRVAAARKAWRAIARGASSTPSGFTQQRGTRLKRMLRSLDASLLGIGYREIARTLFGKRVPTDASWRTDALRATTIRLVRESRELMRGGYLRLLRPDRRKR